MYDLSHCAFRNKPILCKKWSTTTIIFDLCNIPRQKTSGQSVFTCMLNHVSKACSIDNFSMILKMGPANNLP